MKKDITVKDLKKAIEEINALIQKYYEIRSECIKRKKEDNDYGKTEKHKKFMKDLQELLDNESIPYVTIPQPIENKGKKDEKI